jgi:hypothetical protein
MGRTSTGPRRMIIQSNVFEYHVVYPINYLNSSEWGSPRKELWVAIQGKQKRLHLVRVLDWLLISYPKRGYCLVHVSLHIYAYWPLRDGRGTSHRRHIFSRNLYTSQVIDMFASNIALYNKTTELITTHLIFLYYPLFLFLKSLTQRERAYLHNY